MSATIIDGKAIAAQIRAEVAERVAVLAGRGTTPGLAAVLVGDDPASHIYVGMKEKAAAEVGMLSRRIDVPADATQDHVIGIVRDLNADPEITGYIVQLPLPGQISELAVQLEIDSEKDVDCLAPSTLGLLVRGQAPYLPATPGGIVEMLVRSGIEIPGSHVVIVGRGSLVGMPLAVMLAQKSDRANATVTICHTGTRNLAEETLRADILVVATGKPGTVTGDMVKPGATVVDVGINRTDEGLVGDVDFASAAEVAGAITPVPGGVGPLTVAMLLHN
ncbi:MAG: bifunctional 5,10-methylenetetrahydrofolate dehydrogenase/5,10-methenyltetrahydrofolate cyclohydrolase, partial [Actinomycetota bacterium]